MGKQPFQQETGLRREIDATGETDRSQPVGPGSQQDPHIEPLRWRKADLKRGMLGTLEDAVGMLIQVIYHDVRGIHKQVRKVGKLNA